MLHWVVLKQMSWKQEELFWGKTGFLSHRLSPATTITLIPIILVWLMKWNLYWRIGNTVKESRKIIKILHDSVGLGRLSNIKVVLKIIKLKGQVTWCFKTILYLFQFSWQFLWQIMAISSRLSKDINTYSL